MKPVTGRAALLIVVALAAGFMGAFSGPGGGKVSAQANALPQGMLDKEWQLSTYEVAGAAARDVSMFRISIKFGADGHVSGHGGCNGFGGDYQAGANGSITIGQLISTQMFCQGGASDWEGKYFVALYTVSQYKLDGDQLQLIFSNGQGVLSYKAPGAAGAVEGSVTGTVTYRQRIALTPDAVVTVRLLDVSKADAPAEVIAEQTITNPGQVPIAFKITYDPAKVLPGLTYAVSAEISDRGRVVFRTTSQYRVITNGNPTQVALVLDMVSDTSAPTPGASTGPLAGTSWALSRYAVQKSAPVAASTSQRATLTFGSDGRVSGSTGCNSFTGPYTQAAGQLTIGPAVMTLRACLDPEVTRQEQAMARMMNGDTLSVELFEGKLTLTGAAGVLDFTAAGSGPRGAGGQPSLPGMPPTGGEGGSNFFFALVGAALGALALGWRLRRA